ncbi:MAG: hypothetical protein AB7F89_04810 [Pirellulaceae bacterium]
MHAVCLSLLVLGLGPDQPDVIVERVDRIELNHIVRVSVVSDGLGGWSVNCTKAFDYWNVWGWYGFPEYDFHIREWDTARRNHLLVREKGEYALYATGHNGKRYCLRSKVFIETWTLHDPERVDGETFPVNRRHRIPGFRPDSTAKRIDPFGPIH